MRIRTVVVEDQALARERMLELLAVENDVDIVAECASGAEAIAAIRELEPDLVLLDLQMPEMDGFGVVAQIGPSMPLTIFVTAYDEFALKAFDLHAFDYLLKPFGRERVREAIARARTHLHEAREQQLARRFVSLVEHARGATPLVSDRLVVKSGGRLVLLPLEDLDAAESAGNYVRLHAAGLTHVIRETMAALESRLAADHFCRIHRGWIVNLNRVRELSSRPGSDPELVMQDGTRYRVGRAYRDAVERALARQG